MKTMNDEEDLTIEVECDGEVTVVRAMDYEYFNTCKMMEFCRMQKIYALVSMKVNEYILHELKINPNEVDVCFLNMEVDKHDMNFFECDFVLKSKKKSLPNGMMKYHYDNNSELDCYETEMEASVYYSAWILWQDAYK